MKTQKRECLCIVKIVLSAISLPLLLEETMRKPQCLKLKSKF